MHSRFFALGALRAPVPCMVPCYSRPLISKHASSQGLKPSSLSLPLPPQPTPRMPPSHPISPHMSPASRVLRELKEELEARSEAKTGNKAWLRRRLHAAIVRDHLAGE